VAPLRPVDWDASTLDEKVAAFTYWAENYWHIRLPEKGRSKFKMRDAQKETIRVWMGERYSIALKARQVASPPWLARWPSGWRSSTVTVRCT